MAVITCNNEPGTRAVIRVRGNEFTADITQDESEFRERKINEHIKGGRKNSRTEYCKTEKKSVLRGKKGCRKSPVPHQSKQHI